MKQQRYFIAADRLTTLTPGEGAHNPVNIRETVEFEVDAFSLQEAVNKATNILESLDDGYNLFEVTEFDEEGE